MNATERQIYLGELKDMDDAKIVYELVKRSAQIERVRCDPMITDKEFQRTLEWRLIIKRVIIDRLGGVF